MYVCVCVCVCVLTHTHIDAHASHTCTHILTSRKEKKERNMPSKNKYLQNGEI